MTALTAQEFVDACSVDPEVFSLRPDYRAVVLAAEGLQTSGLETEIQGLLARAETSAREAAATAPVADLPHIAAWRDAFRAFGAKPSDYRNSAEALLRRASDGLPRINPLTDIYNALSVIYQAPIGGEDLDGYEGPARLVRARGDEPFDTLASGDTALEYPKPGEVVWRDDRGVTCRRWNWRQCQRTQLTARTTRAFFIIDALGPLSDLRVSELEAELTQWLERCGATLVASRVIAQG